MAKARHTPVRTCVACRLEAGKGELIRLVRTPDGAVTLDRTGRAGGRGAYVHANVACLEVARKKRSIERALRAGMPPGLWSEIGA